jgi:hypothetical protein
MHLDLRSVWVYENVLSWNKDVAIKFSGTKHFWNNTHQVQSKSKAYINNDMSSLYQ